MSNHGQLCRDGIFGNFSQKGRQTINDKSDARFRTLTATNVEVRKTLSVCGNVTIKTQHGDVGLYCVKEGYATAPGGNANANIIDKNTNMPMVIAAGERIIGVSGKGTNVGPLTANAYMNVRVWGNASLIGPGMSDEIFGGNFTHNNGYISETTFNHWNNGVWGWPDGYSSNVSDSGYLGIQTAQPWNTGNVDVKFAIIKIPLC